MALGIGIAVIFLTIVSELLVAFALYSKINHPLTTNRSLYWLVRSLVLSIVLPLSSLALYLDGNYKLFVYYSQIAASIVIVVATAITVVSVNIHLNKVSFQDRRKVFAFTTVVVITLLNSIGNLSVKYVNSTWVISRGNLLNKLLLYIGGTYLFFELFRSFKEAIITANSSVRYLFYSYPLSYTFSLLFLILIENSIIQQEFVYLIPLAIGNFLFLYIIQTSPSLFFLPPKFLTYDLLNQLEISIEVPILVMNVDKEILYFNRKFSDLFFVDYHSIMLKIGQIFDDVIIHSSSHQIFSFEELLNKRSFVADMSVILNSGSNLERRLTLHLEMVDVDGIENNKLLIFQKRNLISNLHNYRDELLDDLTRTGLLDSNLEPLQTLLRGVIYDFDNITERIRNNIKTLEEYTDEYQDDKLVKFKIGFSNIYDALQEANELIFKLNDFVTPPSENVEIFNPLKQIKKVIAQTFQHQKVNFEIVNNEDNYYLQADTIQFEKIIRNLIANAIEASEESDGSCTIEIELKKLTLMDPTETIDSQYNQEFVMITITDNGTGIPEPIQGKIFNPYFTTKSTSRGLGLSIVLGLVKSINGYISLRSTKGRTTFYLYIPSYTQSLQK